MATPASCGDVLDTSSVIHLEDALLRMLDLASVSTTASPRACSPEKDGREHDRRNHIGIIGSSSQGCFQTCTIYACVEVCFGMLQMSHQIYFDVSNLRAMLSGRSLDPSSSLSGVLYNGASTLSDVIEEINKGTEEEQTGKFMCTGLGKTYGVTFDSFTLTFQQTYRLLERHSCGHSLAMVGLRSPSGEGMGHAVAAFGVLKGAGTPTIMCKDYRHDYVPTIDVTDREFEWAMVILPELKFETQWSAEKTFSRTSCVGRSPRPNYVLFEKHARMLVTPLVTPAARAGSPELHELVLLGMPASIVLEAGLYSCKLCSQTITRRRQRTTQSVSADSLNHLSALREIRVHLESERHLMRVGARLLEWENEQLYNYECTPGDAHSWNTWPWYFTLQHPNQKRENFWCQLCQERIRTRSRADIDAHLRGENHCLKLAKRYAQEEWDEAGEFFPQCTGPEEALKKITGKRTLVKQTQGEWMLEIRSWQKNTPSPSSNCENPHS